RFSMMTDLPQRALSRSPRMRMITSVGPPAANGTRIVTFFVGKASPKAWSHAPKAVSPASARPSMHVVRRIGILQEPLRHREHRLRGVVDGRAAQFAAFAEVEATPAMDRGTVVPHDEITDLPFVRIHALAPGGVLEQVGQEQPRLGSTHAHDLACMY